MPQNTDAPAQPIGPPVPGWTPPAPPAREPMKGRFCRLEALNPERHARALYEANQAAIDERNWTYLAYGPFESFGSYHAWVTRVASPDDPLFFAVIDPSSGQAVGVASYLRIDLPNGVIEVGNLNFSPRLQRTPAATEAMYLMMRYAFSLGYRRCEWKCDALNAPSRRAALRLGFSFEGILRQAVIYKGRNRDTAWYAVIDKDWPLIRDAYRTWLDPLNFGADEKQKISLSELTVPLTSSPR